MKPNPSRRCGTCKYWDRENERNEGVEFPIFVAECLFEIDFDELPSCVYRGTTEEFQGKECVAWEKAKVDQTKPNIFVFGSNLAGRHGKGAALFARTYCGAQYGIGVGRTGNAYAIPTKDEKLRTIPLYIIEQHVQDFLAYAREHPELTFTITRIGCGLAGYTDSQIAPMFAGAPSNCDFPEGWTV